MGHGYKIGDTVQKTMGVRLRGLKVIHNFYDKQTAHLGNQDEYVPVQHPDGDKEKYHSSHLRLESMDISFTQLLKEKIEMVITEGIGPWKKYEDNEDNNYHSENVLHMAKHLLKHGLAKEEDVEKAKSILARHKKEGHMSDDNYKDRKVLDDKLWPKFHSTFAPKN